MNFTVNNMKKDTLQLTFNKLLFVELWGSFKKEYPQLSEENIKILSPFISKFLAFPLPFLLSSWR